MYRIINYFMYMISRREDWDHLKTSPDDVVEHIIKLARKGLTPSQIGVTLRDSHGIPQVRFVTGNKILRILKSQGVLSAFLHDSISYTFCRFFLTLLSFTPRLRLLSYAF